VTFITPEARSGPSSSRCQISFRYRPDICASGPTSRVSIRPGGRTVSAQLSFHGRARARSTSWWSQTGSNRRPPACKAGALPTELWPLSCRLKELSLQRLEQEDRDRRRRLLATPDQSFLNLVGLGRFELPTSRLSSARSNQLSYKPGSRGPTDRPPGIRSGPGTTIRRSIIQIIQRMRRHGARPRRKRNVDGGVPPMDAPILKTNAS
jgi:hypothetical protein